MGSHLPSVRLLLPCIRVAPSSPARAHPTHWTPPRGFSHPERLPRPGRGSHHHLISGAADLELGPDPTGRGSVPGDAPLRHKQQLPQLREPGLQPGGSRAPFSGLVSPQDWPTELRGAVTDTHQACKGRDKGAEEQPVTRRTGRARGRPEPRSFCPVELGGVTVSVWVRFPTEAPEPWTTGTSRRLPHGGVVVTNSMPSPSSLQRMGCC